MDGINRYVLMGKAAPNDWKPINELINAFSSESFLFVSEKEALQVKGNLKNYFKNTNPSAKIPLTVVKIRVPIS